MSGKHIDFSGRKAVFQFMVLGRANVGIGANQRLSKALVSDFLLFCSSLRMLLTGIWYGGRQDKQYEHNIRRPFRLFSFSLVDRGGEISGLALFQNS